MGQLARLRKRSIPETAGQMGDEDAVSLVPGFGKHFPVPIPSSMMSITPVSIAIISGSPSQSAIVGAEILSVCGSLPGVEKEKENPNVGPVLMPISQADPARFLRYSYAHLRFP